MSNVVVTLSESDAKWLDEFLQAEYKREGFRPHEKPKPEVQSIGAALQRAMSVSEPLAEKVREFRVARAAALVAVQEAYPIGSDVRMIRNDVKATVFKHSGDSPDCLDLFFENGNVWTKSVDQIERV